jgi:hypothetical protein
MVFPINPNPLPDTTGTSTNKIRVEQVQRVAPVTLNDQVMADPKAAVNLAMPTSHTEASRTARQALAHAGLVAHTDGGTAALTPSQHAAITAAKQLAQNPLTPDLTKLLNSVGDANDPRTLVTRWPDDAVSKEQKPSTTENALRQNLQGLYQNLARSPMFAAHALATLLGPRLGQGHIDDKNSALIQEVNELVQSVSSESPAAKEAARLLMHGILNWQGEFLPGVKASIVREDIWEKDPKHEGQMIRGSKITMEMNLPQTGPFKVVGVQFQDWVNLTIQPPEAFRASFVAERSALESRLKEQIPMDVRYQMAKADNPAAGTVHE